MINIFHKKKKACFLLWPIKYLGLYTVILHRHISWKVHHILIFFSLFLPALLFFFFPCSSRHPLKQQIYHRHKTVIEILLNHSVRILSDSSHTLLNLAKNFNELLHGEFAGIVMCLELDIYIHIFLKRHILTVISLFLQCQLFCVSSSHPFGLIF